MKIKFTILILLCHFYLLGTEPNKDDSISVNPSTNYKNNFGVYLGFTSVLSLDGGDLRNILSTFGYGFSYDHYIYKRYAINLYYSFILNKSYTKDFYNTSFNLFKFDNKLYIKKTNDHIYLCIGAAFQYRRSYLDTFSYIAKQANLLIGFGVEVNLKKLFKKVKTNRIVFDFFMHNGLRFTTIYPRSIYKNGVYHSNPAISAGMFGIKYLF